MKMAKEKCIEEWEPLVVNEACLRTFLFQHEDGRRHLYFTDPETEITGRENTRDVTRLGYRQWDDGVMFLGMSVARRLRGNQLGVSLVNFFRNSMEQRGIPITRTGNIYKPIIALTLSRAGFMPISRDVLVEILPKPAGDESEIPKVNLVSTLIPPTELVDRSESGMFFDIVPPDVVEKSYPITGPEMTVAIHTPYHMP